MLLSLITNMAALTSRANQQYSQLSSKTSLGPALSVHVCLTETFVL